MADFEDYYELLGISPEATAEEIKRAHRDKCFILHPDRMQGAPDSAKKRAEKELVKVNQAYDVLKDSQKRREYHAEWLKRKAKPKPVVKPSRIRFSNMVPGQIKITSFVIGNAGGPYTKIWFSNPDSWLRVINWRSTSTSGELPLEVEVEAKGLNLRTTHTEYIRVKLDEEEVTLKVELQMKPAPQPRPAKPPRTQIPPPSMPQKKVAVDQQWFVTLVLSIFLGFLGADRFYLRQYRWGCWKLLTLAGIGLWWLADIACLIYIKLRRHNLSAALNFKPRYTKYNKAIAVSASICFAATLFSILPSTPPPPGPQSLPPEEFSEPYSVEPTVSISPMTGPVGTRFQVACSGFTTAGSVKADVTNPRGISSSKTFNAFLDGSLALSIDTAGGNPGTYVCSVQDVTTGKSKRIRFEVTSSPGENQSAPVKFDDTFDNPSSGWEQRTDQYVESRYENGEYNILISNTDNPIVRLNKSAGKYDDFTTEVDVIQTGANYPTSRYRGYQAGGLVFWAQDEATCYICYISRFGSYSVQQGTRGDPPIKTWTNSSYIKTGNNTNRLKIVCKGRELKVYLNNNELDTVFIDSGTTGYVGLAAQGNNSQVRFDNFKLYASE